MKDQRKAMVTEITSAIESVINPTGEQPKKAAKAVASIASQIAGRVTKSDERGEATERRPGLTGK